MDYHVARNNEKLGVFAGADAQARFQSGEILPTDLVWCEGMPAWRPAAEVFVGAGPAATPPPVVPPMPAPPPAPGPFSAAPAQPKPDNYLVWAILTTVLCCPAFGIVAIIFAAQVDSKYATGDFAGAQLSSGRAKLWSILAASSFLVIMALYVVGLILFGAAGVLGSMPH